MLEVQSPFDLSTIGSLEFTPNDAVEGLFQNAQRASESPLSKHERIQILEKVIDKASGIREEIAMLIASEGGKPLADATVEVDRGIQGIRNAIETLNAQAGEKIPMGLTPSSENRLAFTTREPIGTVVAISAFNHPFNLVVHQVIPAVATACAVIIKPALTTPLSCVKLVGLVHEAGLPKGRCQLAILDNEGSELLVTDQRVRFFSFIGSAKVGWYLRSKTGSGNALRVGAWWRGSGHHRQQCRYRRYSGSIGQGRILPRGTGLRIRSTDIRVQRHQGCVRPSLHGCGSQIENRRCLFA
jgi:acyl-CoA reductase-like NAD-dependent aldehyde dehydrogenase